MGNEHEKNTASGEIARMARRLRQGDASAWEEFVGSFHGKLIRHFRVQGFDAHKAEDLAQETFARAYSGIHALRNGTSLIPWLYGIMRNVRLEARKDTSRHPLLRAINKVEVENLPAAEHDAREIPERETLTRLDGLADDEIDLLYLRFGLEYSIADCARILDRSYPVTYMRLRRLVRRLRRVCAKENRDFSEKP